MARADTSPPRSVSPRAAGGSVPWMVFLALIVCLAVVVGVQDSLGHPAGWLDQVAGREDTVPTFAADATPDTDGRPVRIVPLAPNDPAVVARVRPPQEPPSAVDGATETPSGTEAGAAEPSPTPPAPDPTAAAEQTPAPPDTRTPGRALATRTITRAAPLRVYVAGDSSAEGLGYELQRLGARDGLVTAVIDFKISSGLANPGYFNWPDRLRQAMSNQPSPEAVILFLGGNDNLSMRTPQGTIQPGRPGWQAEYAWRAGELMDIAGRDGARVYWVGMPVVRDPDRNDSVAAINAALAQAATERPWVRYVDVAPLFGDVHGDYDAHRPDIDGEPTKVRQDDGIHLTRTGSNWVAAAVYDLILRDIRTAP